MNLAALRGYHTNIHTLDVYYYYYELSHEAGSGNVRLGRPLKNNYKG